MADLTASILTLIDAATRLGKLIHNIHNAPVELLSLSNEANDLCIVYRELERVHIRWPNASGNLSLPLQRANEKIAALRTLLDGIDGKAASAKGRVDWVFRKKGKIRKMQEELMEVRRQLDTLIATNSLSGSYHIELAVEHLSFHAGQMFQRGQARISEQLDDLNSTVKSLAIAVPASTPNGSHTQSPAALPAVQPSQNDTVAISVCDISPSCPIWCGCACHARQSINLFNILFIGYNALPFRPRKCSERSCNSRFPGFRARMTYYFPRYFLSKALAIHIGMSQYKEPTFSLTVRNVVPVDAPIFIAAASGNVEKLKLLLGSREANPNDLHVLDGSTALHHAVRGKSFQAVSLLINAGANPNIENHNQMTAIDWDWTISLRFGTVGQPVEETVHSIFPLHDISDAWMLTVLHKCVLGFIVRNIEVELSLSTADIDTRDVHGRTPLSWACNRCDAHAAWQLLQFGADPNIADNEGYSPLLNAAWRGCLELCILLIESGADILHASKCGENALHYASKLSSSDTETFMQRILGAGGQKLINVQDDRGRAPLSWAAEFGTLTLARLLLVNDADVEIKDNKVWTPLLRSRYNHNDITSLLLGHGASHSVKDKDGWTSLHFAVRYGNVATLEILAGFNLNGLDPEATTIGGYTAADLFKFREESTPDEFMGAFQRLLDRLRFGSDSEDRQSIEDHCKTSSEDVESSVATDEEDEEDEEKGEGEFKRSEISLIPSFKLIWFAPIIGYWFGGRLAKEPGSSFSHVLVCRATYSLTQQLSRRIKHSLFCALWALLWLLRYHGLRLMHMQTWCNAPDAESEHGTLEAQDRSSLDPVEHMEDGNQDQVYQSLQ